MFPTSKHVDLGGRSTKERDRSAFLEQIKLERKLRQEQIELERKSRQEQIELERKLLQRKSAAIKIQRYLRWRKLVGAEKTRMRAQFYGTYGKDLRNVNRSSFGPNSRFLGQLLFFLDTQRDTDFSTLSETCRLLQQFVNGSGDIVGLLAGTSYTSKHHVNYRVKQLAFLCIKAFNQKRDKLFAVSQSNKDTNCFLGILDLLIDPNAPWACKTVSYLLRRKAFTLFKEIILTGRESIRTDNCLDIVSSLEHILALVIPHIVQKPCSCPDTGPHWSFISQIPAQIPALAVDLAAVATFLLEVLPSIKLSNREIREESIWGEDDMITGDDPVEIVLNKDLERQICNVIDACFLQPLKKILGQISHISGSHNGPDDKELSDVGVACDFLNIIFNTFHSEGIISILANETELLPLLLNLMKWCHENQKWLSLSKQLEGTPGWLLPLAVFGPVYRHWLMDVDIEEFYKMKKPLSLEDIRCLVIILREALWKLLMVNPNAPTDSSTFLTNAIDNKRCHVEFIQQRVRIVAFELLSELHDWNIRQEFMAPSDFHADGVNEIFMSQAVKENTRANGILKNAPLLVPYKKRVEIFMSQLEEDRLRHGRDSVFYFYIRRNHILEDTFNQMKCQMSRFRDNYLKKKVCDEHLQDELLVEHLRGLIFVTFEDEFGVEEDGHDLGGLFKDFMEEVIRTAFSEDVGLFKEAENHLLYPNPDPALILKHHDAESFFFLGVLLGKAVFEGVHVCLPFAKFFLSKLKQKCNYLNDLRWLDPGLYHTLVNLKKTGDFSTLELFFVIGITYADKKYVEVELVPGGNDLRVTEKNLTKYIRLYVNYFLNIQIRQQSADFLRGFQLLIKKDWIDMFTEYELQLLISGYDGLDVDDLRLHTVYEDGYHNRHNVIERFWQVLKSFSPKNQQKFLKFVTGCSRGPLLGFKYLNPLFCICMDAAPEEALQRYPSASTCANMLKLPLYSRKKELKKMLMLAITKADGFHNV